MTSSTIPSITEIAALCGVSVQSIRAWCRRNQVAKDAKGKWKLDESTLSLLYEYYQVKPGESSESKGESTCASSETLLSAALQAEVDHLRAQLKVKDKQIADLSQALLNAQQEVRNAQQLHGADKAQRLIESQPSEQSEQQPKKTRWQRLKEAWRG